MPDESDAATAMPALKRGRVEWASDISDALRGEPAKALIVGTLKCPKEFDTDFLWTYPHLFCAQAKEWVQSLRNFQLAQGVLIQDSSVIHLFELYIRDVAQWCNEHHLPPTSRAAIDPVFSKVGLILQILAQSKFDTRSQKVQFDVQEALAKGFLDFPAIWKTMLLKSFSFLRAGERARGRGRGRGRGSFPPNKTGPRTSQ